MQLPFRSEIRYSPCHPTIKIFVKDETMVEKIRLHLGRFKEIDIIEVSDSVEQNSADESITIFLNHEADLKTMKTTIDSSLWWYFEEDLKD